MYIAPLRQSRVTRKIKTCRFVNGEDPQLRDQNESYFKSFLFHLSNVSFFGVIWSRFRKLRVNKNVLDDRVFTRNRKKKSELNRFLIV